ncbi:MAG: oxidoreductase [Gammaproteobacteria bacterium TMED95]|nr:oxidoreductase [Gammaproteobacteria bacterium]OUV20117.1 MAG: oxidoreductase [Gammaproteobacteria bacterium TMED95]
MTEFKAFWVEKDEQGVRHEIVTRRTDELPEGEILVEVLYSSVNYKDAMSATGVPGVTREYPHQPGIDAAGIIRESTDPNLPLGEEVIVIGFDLGMNTPGGFGQFIRVPSDWVVPLPAGLSLRESMILGTAGLTAALCMEKLEWMNAQPQDGPVLVTGATGGVGSVAVSLLASLGFEVVAMTGKEAQHDYLKALGASEIVSREALGEVSARPMLKPAFAHAIDTVGGDILTNVVKSLQPQGSVAICGLVASANFDVSVLPFILRGVNVLGVDSVELPLEDKARNWQRLAEEWRLPTLEQMTLEIGLEEISETVDSLMSGSVVGRTLVKLN